MLSFLLMVIYWQYQSAERILETLQTELYNLLTFQLVISSVLELIQVARIDSMILHFHRMVTSLQLPVKETGIFLK